MNSEQEALPGPAASEAIAEFARTADPSRLSRRLELDGGEVKNGLAQLVLTLVKLLHELLERQAIRRMEAGSLTEVEIERLGMALMRQAEELEHLREAFGLAEEDLNLDLGPLGRLL
jgi:hypothetical protein